MLGWGERTQNILERKYHVNNINKTKDKCCELEFTKDGLRNGVI